MIRTVLLLALVASLGLAACGKKGPLGPPSQGSEESRQFGS